MLSKQFFLRKAKAGFPEYYEDFIKKNPQYKLPDNYDLPLVIELRVDYIDKKHGTAIEIFLTAWRKGKTYLLRGACFSDEFDADCIFFQGGPEAMRKFARIFAAHLIYNVMSEHNISVEEWNELPNLPEVEP